MLFTTVRWCKTAIQGISNQTKVVGTHYSIDQLGSNMIFNIRKQISYLSQGTTLEAGSLLLTGTPAGIGYFRDPRVVLKDGDDIRVYVEKIGTLVNRVRYE